MDLRLDLDKDTKRNIGRKIDVVVNFFYIITDDDLDFALGLEEALEDRNWIGLKELERLDALYGLISKGEVL